MKLSLIVDFCLISSASLSKALSKKGKSSFLASAVGVGGSAAMGCWLHFDVATCLLPWTTTTTLLPDPPIGPSFVPPLSPRFPPFSPGFPIVFPFSFCFSLCFFRFSTTRLAFSPSLVGGSCFGTGKRGGLIQKSNISGGPWQLLSWQLKGGLASAILVAPQRRFVSCVGIACGSSPLPSFLVQIKTNTSHRLCLAFALVCTMDHRNSKVVSA